MRALSMFLPECPTGRRWRLPGGLRSPRLAALPVLLACAAALATALPLAFTHVGSFRHMSHTGDTAGQARLASLPQQPGTWGLGATAGLKGEIVQLDGRLLVSPGSDARGALRPPQPDEEALLYASARVQRWVDVPVPRDMEQPQWEVFVRDEAAARGLPPGEPFVFRVEGRFPRMRWHVVTGDAPAGQHGAAPGHFGGGGHANAQAGMRVFHSPGTTGQLVGVYSGEALEGVVSHPGERFHLHYVDAAASVSGHVDGYAVARGAVLKLPLP